MSFLVRMQSIITFLPKVLLLDGINY